MSFIVRWVQKKGRSARWIEYHIRGKYPDGVDYEERRKSPRSTITASERYADDREKFLHEKWQRQRHELFKAPPFGHAWTAYLEYSRTVKRNMSSTLKWKTKVHKHFLSPHIADDLRVDKIEEDLVDKLVTALSRLGPKTVNTTNGVLHSFLVFCARKKWIIRVPHFEPLPLERRIPKRLVLDDYERLLGGCRELERELGLWQPLVMCQLGGDAGLRMQETIALLLADVDLVGARLFVQRAWSDGVIVSTKGKRFRVVTIEPPLVKLLGDHQHSGKNVLQHDGKTQWNGSYNKSNADKEVTPAVAYRWFFMAVARAKISPNGRLHVLRHTFGSGLADAGVDAHKIKDLLGHANIATSEIYIELAGGATRAATQQLEQYRRAQEELKKAGPVH